MFFNNIRKYLWDQVCVTLLLQYQCFNLQIVRPKYCRCSNVTRKKKANYRSWFQDELIPTRFITAIYRLGTRWCGPYVENTSAKWYRRDGHRCLRRGVADRAYTREIDRDDAPIAYLLSSEPLAAFEDSPLDGVAVHFNRIAGRSRWNCRPEEATNFPTWLKFHEDPRGSGEECGSGGEDVGARHVIPRSHGPRSCDREPRARPVVARERSLDFFFPIRASRTIEQRLASTTRFRIVVCGRSTSPKRKVARAATTRSHHTPCLYRYARGTRLQVDPKARGKLRGDRFTWCRRRLWRLKRPLDRRRSSGVPTISKSRASFPAAINWKL